MQFQTLLDLAQEVADVQPFHAPVVQQVARTQVNRLQRIMEMKTQLIEDEWLECTMCEIAHSVKKWGGEGGEMYGIKLAPPFCHYFFISR